MKTSQITFLLLFFALISTSCEPVVLGPEADLRVQIKGTFSGKSREGVQIQLYSTRQDAQNAIDPLSPVLWTDRTGQVEFYELFVNKKYFIRIDGPFGSKTRSSRRLDYGFNNCVINIL